MNNKKFEIQGIRFANEEEYTAGLSDVQKIEEIKEKYDLHSEEDLQSLMSKMQSGVYHFETEIGREFDDSVYELYLFNSKDNRIEKQERVDKVKNDKNQTSTPEKQKKHIWSRKLVILVLSLVGAVCIGFFILYCYDIWKNEQKQREMAALVEPESVEKVFYTSEGEIVTSETIPSEEWVESIVLEKYENLYNHNKKLIGWLKIDDTIIDYPVMQTDDNEYYLTHGYEQDYDRNGSLFLDYSCSIAPKSTNLIIYGHHMKSGKMFGTLNKYQDVKYYEKHREILFDTIYEEGKYEVMYVFRSKVFSEEEVVFKYYQFIEPNSEAEFTSAMQEMQQMSLYDTGVTAEYGDELLTLSTCDYAQEDGRFVVVAKKVQ